MNRIGIDIGGTQLRVAAYSEAGEELAKQAIPNDHELGPEENLQCLVDCINEWGLDYAGIGVGSPGPLDIAKGCILSAPNLPGWDGFQIVRFFEEATGHKTYLENDAKVAGLAEARLGAGKGKESVFYFTVSTGVGGAFIYRGEIVAGANWCAGEIFNMVLNGFEDVRPFMNKGSLEDQTSGSAMRRLASKRLGRKVGARELFSLYAEGNEAARAIIDNAADVLAKAVHNVACVVDPDVFVFGGSVALYNQWFIEDVYERAKHYVINPQALHFEFARCGGDVGLIGASLLVE